MKGIKGKEDTLRRKRFFVLRPTAYPPALREWAGNLQSRNFSKGFTPHHPLLFVHAKGGDGAGFTFIETLIAVTILTLALAGTLTIVSRSVIASVYARDQIIAFYLAQEAIELLQNKRSTNVLQYGASGWLTDFGPCIPGPCAIDIDGTNNVRIRNSVNGCPGRPFGVCQPLKFNGTLYDHGNVGPDTIFRRKVSIDNRIDYDDPPDGVYDDIAISVTVTWTSGKVDRTFTIRHNMLNWQE